MTLYFQDLKPDVQEEVIGEVMARLAREEYGIEDIDSLKDMEREALEEQALDRINRMNQGFYHPDY